VPELFSWFIYRAFLSTKTVLHLQKESLICMVIFAVDWASLSIRLTRHSA
jgi:hypothetical protein